MTQPTINKKTNIHWQHYIGIFLLSMATLLLELALTRVLSVANWYHFGFLVISTALLGFGASGVVLSLCPKLLDVAQLDHALGGLALLFGLVSLASFWLMQRIPFQPFLLLLDRWQLLYMLLYYFTLAAPFFCSGLAISLMLTRGSREVNRLYAADLLGAGLGCTAAFGTLAVFGGAGSIVIAAMIGVRAALVFSSFRLNRLTFASGLAAVGMVVLAFRADQVLPITVTPGKHHHPLFPETGSPIFTKWNSFSKIDVYDAPLLDRERPDPGYYSIIIDGGAAGTGIQDLSMGVRNYLARARDYHPPGVAYVGKEHPRVLIIGSGAGREVLEGLYFGASSITAVEINPITTDLVTKRMATHWGGLFVQPEVRLVTEDGRSFVRRSREKYDIIISVNTYSETALTSGALTLSESYILTREAFEDYWNHLTPDGTLLVTGYSLGKLVATAREMFDHLGAGSPADHLFAFRGVVAPFGRMHVSPGFVLKKLPLLPAEVDAMAQRVGIGENKNWGEEGKPEIAYSPFQQPHNRIQTLLADLVKSPKLQQIYASSREYLYPATDDKPFFNQTRHWNPRLGFRGVFGAGSKEVVDTLPIAQVTLIVLLIQALVVAGVMILLPLIRFNRRGLQVHGRWAWLAYFSSLGVGFILVEIVLLVRLQLFLGQPIYTFSVVLGGLLVFTGVGSFLAGRIHEPSYRIVSLVLVAVVGTILLTSVLIPPVLGAALGFRFPWRVGLSLLFVAPMGIALGMPFPTGLRLVSKDASPLVAWAWAVNSFFTVIGSVGSMILGMVLGFTAVLYIAAACYVTALLATLYSGCTRVRQRSHFQAGLGECQALTAP